MWSGEYGKYKVTVEVITPKPGEKGNTINIHEGRSGTEDRIPGHRYPGDRASHVHGPNMDSGDWFSNDPGWTAAHEAGHLMGLRDYYSEGPPGPNGERTNRVESGWSGNIMATWGGSVDERNIEEVLKKNK